MDTKDRVPVKIHARLLGAMAAFIAVVALVAGVVSSAAPLTTGLIVAALLVAGIWMALPSDENATPKWLTLFMLLFVFSTVLPTAVSLVVQFAALVGGFVLWLAHDTNERRGGSAVLWTALILLFWCLLCFHPNIPSLEVGILGLRKTTLCVAGVIAGAAVASQFRRSVEKTVIKILILAMTISIGLHLFVPSLELSIGRSAGEYTSVLGGEARLQGVFAGPFHVALAALILFAWSFARWSSDRTLASIALTVGTIGLYLSLVRTAYVALVLVIALAILLAPQFGIVLRRTATFVLVASVMIMVVFAANPALLAVMQSILDFSSDNRFLGRFEGYDRSIALILDSPIIGWGSGSAGDTLSAYFANGEHTTSHNIFLKILVEGGIVGFLLWAGFIVVILKQMKRDSPFAITAILSLTAIAGMGLTTASLEALPISYIAFFFAGLAIQPARIDFQDAATTKLGEQAGKV